MADVPVNFTFDSTFLERALDRMQQQIAESIGRNLDEMMLSGVTQETHGGTYETSYTIQSPGPSSTAAVPPSLTVQRWGDFGDFYIPDSPPRHAGIRPRRRRKPKQRIVAPPPTPGTRGIRL